MQTVTVKVQFPKDVFLHWGKSKEQVEKDVKKAMALELFREKRLSFGKAAELSGMCLSDFMDLTREYKIPVANYSKEELEEEIKTSKGLSKKLKKVSK
jgi:predicted HTH domain antitoxin